MADNVMNVRFSDTAETLILFAYYYILIVAFMNLGQIFLYLLSLFLCRQESREILRSAITIRSFNAAMMDEWIEKLAQTRRP